MLNTNDRPYGVGRATYVKPLHLWDDCSLTHQADFTTHFSFTMDNVSESEGAGLAFFLAPFGNTAPLNSGGENLGLFDQYPSTTGSAKAKNQIVAVEFDTSPRQHVSINENSINPLVNASWDPNSQAGKAVDVWITYNSKTKNLSVFWTNSTSRGNSSLSCFIDLKEALPERVTIGFSASTRLKLERHCIHSWDFHSNLDSMKVSCSKKRRKKILALSVAVIFSILMLLVWIISWLILRRRRTKNGGPETDAYSDSSITDLERGALRRKFSYTELIVATNGFANDRKLGQGGSGEVYKGTSCELGRPVAVKRIFTDAERSQSLFINEVKIMSRLIHRNLVQLIGWCHEQGEFLLVYENMPNGSLDHHLFGNAETLPWNARYKIAIGLASALHYLHEEAEQYCVLHRDIKSANVLLDTDFSAKLGDFGVAKLVDPRLRTHTTGVVGTYGYLAPEYANEGRASRESDMFSFGAVALEIACGRRTFQDGAFHVPLVKWVSELYLAGDILEAADEKLGKSFARDEMKRLLMVGLWCTHPNDRERPKAGQVIKVLQFEAPLPELPQDLHDHGSHPLILQPQGPPYSFQLSITSSLNDVGR